MLGVVLVAVIVAIAVLAILLVRRLDSPYRSGPGGLQPTAMKRTLVVLEEERVVAGGRVPVLCDAAGGPL